MFPSPPLSLVLAAFTVLATAAPTTASNVLTPQNFKETIAQGVWFIEYFSPYCPHCRRFEPTWNELVGRFEGMPDPGVHLAQVNCALNGDLCNENGVTGYPQMNLYRNGEFAKTFDGDRESYFLVEFLEKHAEPEGTSKEVDMSTPEPTDQVASPAPAPTPTPMPAPDKLVVQTPRTDTNPSGTVVSLDVQHFDSFLTQGPAFIKFFAPWCGHCKKLAPAWAQLGRRMQHKLNVAEVDCEQHKALCTSQGVTGFPMMFFYAHGTKTEYTSGRSYDQLVAFADKASNPTMQVIDAPELDRIVHENPVFYLLLHDASDQGMVTDVAKGAQALLGSPPVYLSTSSDLFHKYTISTSSALLAFKGGDAHEPVAVFYPASLRGEALHAWMYANRFPSSFELSKAVFQQVMYAPHRPLVVIVATPEGERGVVPDKLDEIARKWRLRVRAAAGRSGGGVAVGAGAGVGTDGVGLGARDVVFAWMDADQWGKWMKNMYGVKVKTEPVVIVADHERLMYYDKDASGHDILLNSVSVASALESILSGTARPKHSRNVLERAVEWLNASFVTLEGNVAKHPYVTILVVLGFVGAMAMALRSLFKDDSDWIVEKRYAKGDRLD